MRLEAKVGGVQDGKGVDHVRAKIRVDISDFEVAVALPPVSPIRVVADELLPAGPRGRRRRRGRWRRRGSGRRRCGGDRGIGGDGAPVAVDIGRPIAAAAGRVEEEA